MAALQLLDSMTGDSLGLAYGLSDLLVATIGGRQVLYAFSRTEATLVEVGIGSDGSLSVVNSLSLTGTFAPGSDPVLGLVGSVGAGQSLLIAGMSPSTGQGVDLSSAGALGEQTPLSVTGLLVAPTSLDLDGTAAFVSGRQGTGGLDLFLGAGDVFVRSASLEDTDDRALADVAAAVSVEHDGKVIVATVSASENGLSLVAATPGGLEYIGGMGASEGLPIGGPSDIEIIQRLDETLLVVSGRTSSSLSVITLGAGGAPILSDHILDAPWTRFQGAEAVATATYGDFAFVAAGGSEGGVSLFTVLPGGRMIHLSSVSDTNEAPLYRVSALEAQVANDRLDIFGVSALEAGIARLSYDLSGFGSVVLSSGGVASGTAMDDQLIGSATADVLSGAAGDDILFDGAGEDILRGGAGADHFVLHNDGQVDTILDFERGVDRLDSVGLGHALRGVAAFGDINFGRCDPRAWVREADPSHG